MHAGGGGAGGEVEAGLRGIDAGDEVALHGFELESGLGEVGFRGLQGDFELAVV
ncbi:MAG: hypothetical protein JOZ79_12850 [Sphingomonas sp.]|nr:hypothetical protein [Sphingomonas sp.]